MQTAIRQKGRAPRIAIIGAGISGLRCADVLIRSGVKVTIYEARDRIGGRVHQVSSGGRLIDTGASWIHGTRNNPIADIARSVGSSIYDSEEDQAIIDTAGNRLDNNLATEVSNTFWQVIAKAFRYSDENSATIDKSNSLMEYFREQIPNMVQDPFKQSLILEEAQMWGSFVGDSVEKQSLKFFFLEECIDAETPFVADTYKKILSSIAATALSKAEIHYNEEAIFFDTQNGTSGADSDPQTTIHTRSGKQHTYDEVVITAPLGWLKRHARDAFHVESPLPPRLLQAIDNVGYGRLEKVHITFPSAFWQEEAACDLSSKASSSATMSSSYPATHFHNPDYTPHPPKTPWNQSMINLAALPATDAHPTLLFYLYGDGGAHLIKLLAEKVSTTETNHHDVIRSFFEPYYSRLPNYDPTSSSCTPIAFQATDWQSDPFAGHGSYTNFPTGRDQCDRDIEVMRYGGTEAEAKTDVKTDSQEPNPTPITHTRGIWLAGEHTAPFIAIGTTTGAYWSGEAVARTIMKLYGLGT